MLLACLCVYLFLQLPASLWMYQFLAPLQVVAYPYRMLTFITPIGVILVIATANYLFRNFPASVIPKVVAVMWLVALIVLSPITSTWSVNYGFLARSRTIPPHLRLSTPALRGLSDLQGILLSQWDHLRRVPSKGVHPDGWRTE